jgi:hypothetical protein
MKRLATFAAIPTALMLIGLTGCSTTPDNGGLSASDIAQQTAREHQRHGAIAALGLGSAVTELMARHDASGHARKELTSVVDLHIASLKQELLRSIGTDRQAEVDAFFHALTDEVKRKVPITSRIVFTIEEPLDTQTNGYAVAIQNPSLLLAYIDLHGAEHPTIYPLLRASNGYRKLLQGAAAYRQYIDASCTKP